VQIAAERSVLTSSALVLTPPPISRNTTFLKLPVARRANRSAMCIPHRDMSRGKSALFDVAMLLECQLEGREVGGPSQLIGCCTKHQALVTGAAFELESVLNNQLVRGHIRTRRVRVPASSPFRPNRLLTCAPGVRRDTN
jgi:hypothetical protein